MYRIYYQPSNGSEALKHIDVSHTTRRANVTGLRKFVSYYFTVAAFTTAGIGPRSEMKEIMTDTDGKLCLLPFLVESFSYDFKRK